VLAFALIILSILLASALAISATTVIERKNSLTGNSSTQAFQAADSGAEAVIPQIRTAQMGTPLSANGCLGASGNSVVYGSGTYLVKYYKSDGTTQLNCTDTVDNVGILKSSGVVSNTTRAVDVNVVNYQALIFNTVNLTSYWQMDNSSWSDEKGLNNLTASGGATFISGASAKMGGSSGSFPNNAFAGGQNTTSNAPLNNLQNWTWEGWVYSAAYNSGYLYSEGYPQKTFYIYIDATGKIYVSTYNLSYAGNWKTANTNAVVTANLWHHIAITLAGGGSGTGTLKIFVDGIAAAIASGGGQKEQYSVPVTYFGLGDNVGAYNGGGQSHSYFSGYLDEVAIYSRALSPTEIATHAANR